MAAVAERVRACSQSGVAAIAPRLRSLGGADRGDVAEVDAGAGVERCGQGGAVALLADGDPRRATDQHVAVLETDADAFVVAHGLAGAQHERLAVPRSLDVQRRGGDDRAGHGGAGGGDLGVEVEGGAHVAADVLAHRGAVDVFGVDPVQQPAGLFGALGRVLGQVAGDLAALLARREDADVDLAAPPDARVAELLGDRSADVGDRGADGLLEQLAGVDASRWPDLLGCGSRASRGPGARGRADARGRGAGTRRP